MTVGARPRMMDCPPVLSHVQARSLLQARAGGRERTAVSLDLGLSLQPVDLELGGVLLPDGQRLAWDCLAAIAGNELACYAVCCGEAEPIRRFSEALNRVYSLMPTSGAPTLLVSGIAMHRIQGIDPRQDTLRKVRTLAPVVGRVLDTCTGLGYTAIEAARTADQVVTLELDPLVLEVARFNPWSRALFDTPTIDQRVGDASVEIETLEGESFSRILHDPPMFSLGGDLYSGEFYRQLARVLRRGGRLFHYIGDLDSRSGRNVARGVVRRLQEAGFSRIVRRPEAFGVVAHK